MLTYNDTQKTSDEITYVIELWLHAKYSRTQSACTEETYRETLLSLRAYLQERGMDLDNAAVDIAPFLQAWARQRALNSKRQGDIAPSTYNQRIAATSSFYDWAREQGIYVGDNPAALLTRATVQKYAKAHVLDPQQVRTNLKNIDRSTPRGLRDYVLLQVALNTGRSAREMVSLLWRCVYIAESGTVTLTFERCRGGKTMQDELDPRLSKVLLSYLHTIYGDRLDILAPERPIWVSFSDRTYGQAIGAQTVADICETHLGVSTVHTLRHTFALTMEDLGAHMSSIQERLGYESLTATSGYLTSLRRTQGDALSQG